MCRTISTAEEGGRRRWTKDATFKQWVFLQDEGITDNGIGGRHLVPQIDFLVDEDDRVIVDFIGRFENLNEDWRNVCGVIGIDEQLPKRNSRREKEHYSTYYDDDTLEVVRRRFQRDIKVFGYEFEKQ